MSFPVKQDEYGKFSIPCSSNQSVKQDVDIYGFIKIPKSDGTIHYEIPKYGEVQTMSPFDL